MVNLKHTTAKRGGCHELNGTMESTKYEMVVEVSASVNQSHAVPPYS